MKKGLFALASAIALMGSNPFDSGIPQGNIEPPTPPKEPPVPKGCKRYYFDNDGECIKGEHLVYFDAMKEETAVKKWERWMEKQNPGG